MDSPIQRAEYEEFRRTMEAENQRLADEDSRQNHRIDILEQNVEKLGALASSVERLAVSMENMAKEQERQGKRLDALEVRDEVSMLKVAMEHNTTTMENAIETQKQQGERLKTIENRDGEMWRKVVGHIATTILGIVLAYIFYKIGMGG